MKRAAILVAALLIARPDPVLAGSSCGSSGGGGSSSGGSSSSSSDSSSSYSDSSSSSSTPKCQDTTDVVGYRECTRFGAWANNMKVPAIIIELGTTMRSAPSLAGDQGGAVTHGSESFAYRTIAPPEAGSDQQLVTTLRMGVGSRSGVFFAVDVEAGPIVSQARARTEMTGSGVFGSPTITQSSGVAINAAAVAGFRRRLGAGRVGVELAGGVRSAHYSFTSSYHHCETVTSMSASAPLLEARAGYEAWLAPFVSVGATVGSSLIDQGAWMGGLHVGFHSRAFGSSR